MVGAISSRIRNGRTVDSEPAGLREGIPRIWKVRSRELKVFGAIEVAHHQFLPGEIETLPFKGHVVNLHLSAPHRLVQKQNGRTHEGLIAPNDMTIIPAGTPGYWRTDVSSDDMSMLLEGRFIRRVAVEAGAGHGEIEVVPNFGSPDPQIERIGLSFLSEMTTGGLGGELFADSLANLLALHLVRQYSSLRGSSMRETRSAGSLSERALGQATDYINDNLSGKVTLTEVAGAACLSPHHFARSFKAATGLSPHQYVIRRRVERAKTLLTENDLPIAQIAEAVGFANQSHLAFHTRRLLGISPTALTKTTSLLRAP